MIGFHESLAEGAAGMSLMGIAGVQVFQRIRPVRMAAAAQK